MNISRGSKLCGVEVVRLRDALRRANPTYVTPHHLAELLGIDVASARALCAEMAAEGFLQPIHADGELGVYTLTVKGGALRNASARKPVRRATAERHLALFLERVEQVNANDELLYEVHEVLLFGSMLTDAETVSDVDVAVGLVAKSDDPARFEAWVNERIQMAGAAGRRFSNLVDQIGWPRQEVMAILKGRSPVLSLTTTEDRVLEATASRMLYAHGAPRS